MVDIIWDWVSEAKRALEDSGRGRLAHLMTQISWYTCDEKHAQVDAIYPEALALSREAGNPWIEVFIRHWNLQSRILHRHHVGDWMAEAVSLIEFANRPETRDCPQSICTTQDLVNCYGNIDGPGFAEERIVASRETLSRIDPTWPCYQCIGGELIAALNDAGRLDEALETLDRMELDVRQARRQVSPYPMVETRVQTLRLLGRLDEALAVNAVGRDHINDDGEVRKRAQERALLLALQGDAAGALEALPSFATIQGTHSTYLDWSETQRLIAEVDPLRNDWSLDDALRILAAELLANGVLRDAFQILVWRGELACLRGRARTAERVFAEAEAIVPRLRAPLDAPAQLAALTRSIARIPAPQIDLGEAPDALIETLGINPEEDAVRLYAAQARWPDHREIMLQLGSALRGMSLMADALGIYQGWLAEHPDDVNTINLLGSTLLMSGDVDGAAAVLPRLQACDHPEAEVIGSWFAYRLEIARGDLDRARPHLERVVALAPSAVNATEALVGHLVERDALPAALDHLDRLCGLVEEVGGYDWERMVVATCLDRWASVRDSAARVGWTLEGEGPIEESWELVMIRFTESDGDELDLFAQRTGPVTAKIVAMATSRDRAHYLDRVVFRATPLNEAPDEETEDHLWVYPVMRVLEPGGYRVYPIFGLHPGAEAAEALWQRLADLNVDISVRSDETYEVYNEADESTRLGLYAVFAVPETAILTAVADAVASEIASYEFPLVCPDLWDALERHEEAAAQRRSLDVWGF